MGHLLTRISQVRSHASNPTAWQLWDPQTLALAKETNRLLFVSIGYSACHWCHVMAHESFDHPQVAKLLNDNFIPIKIDREERPDVDRVYMDFLQATTGGGGWPLNVFVTPELEPIYGGTYWPGPGSERAGMGGGVVDILKKVSLAWSQQEDKCRHSAGQITAQLKQFAQEGTLSGRRSGENFEENAEDMPELELLEDAYEHYKGRFDSKFGGFGGAPKFPTPTHLAFLLRLGAWDGTTEDIVSESDVKNGQEMAYKTLEHMAQGGIKDQIGTGFARYSVTRDWSLPHFEKMLYDNAQLLPVFLDAYLQTKSPLFLSTVHDIASYLTSPPISSPEGGFHASEDADSAPTAYDDEHKEGAFYVWSLEEFRKAIDDEKTAEMCAKYWDIREDGNVSPRNDVQGELEGKNTVCVTCTIAELAKEFSVTEEEAVKTIESARRKLLLYRDETRPRPHLDDKIVVSWNGLAIGGLARTAAVLAYTDSESASHYLKAAESAAAFIKKSLFNAETHQLLRVYREGPGQVPGFADDYAFLISGLLDLYEATFDDAYLQWATELQETQIKLFFDNSKGGVGGFYSTSADASDVLIRSKDAMDNAEPSTNGVSAQNLFRLGSMLDDERFTATAKKTVKAFDVELSQHPGLLTGLLGAVITARMGIRGMMLSGESQGVEDAAKTLRLTVRPGSTVVRVGGGSKSQWLKSRNELLKDLDEKKEMIQLCEGRQCKLLKPEQIPQAIRGEL